MKNQIEKAVIALADKSKVAVSNSAEAMHLTQSVLNLTHALATLDQIKLNNKS